MRALVLFAHPSGSSDRLFRHLFGERQLFASLSRVRFFFPTFSTHPPLCPPVPSFSARPTCLLVRLPATPLRPPGTPRTAPALLPAPSPCFSPSPPPLYPNRRLRSVVPRKITCDRPPYRPHRWPVLASRRCAGSRRGDASARTPRLCALDRRRDCAKPRGPPFLFAASPFAVVTAFVAATATRQKATSCPALGSNQVPCGLQPYALPDEERNWSVCDPEQMSLGESMANARRAARKPRSERFARTSRGAAATLPRTCSCVVVSVRPAPPSLPAAFGDQISSSRTSSGRHHPASGGPQSDDAAAARGCAAAHVGALGLAPLPVLPAASVLLSVTRAAFAARAKWQRPSLLAPRASYACRAQRAAEGFRARSSFSPILISSVCGRRRRTARPADVSSASFSLPSPPTSPDSRVARLAKIVAPPRRGATRSAWDRRSTTVRSARSWTSSPRWWLPLFGGSFPLHAMVPPGRSRPTPRFRGPVVSFLRPRLPRCRDYRSWTSSWEAMAFRTSSWRALTSSSVSVLSMAR